MTKFRTVTRTWRWALRALEIFTASQEFEIDEMSSINVSYCEQVSLNVDTDVQRMISRPICAVHRSQSFETRVENLNDVSPGIFYIHTTDPASQFNGDALSASSSLQYLLDQGVRIWVGDANVEEATSMVIELLLAFLEARIDKLEHFEPDAISCGHVC